MKGVVEAYLQAINDKDLDAVHRLYSAEGSCEDPYGTPAKNGLEEIGEFYANAFTYDLRAKASGPVRCAGDAAAFPFVLFVGERKTEVIAVMRFTDDGSIANFRAYWGKDNVSKGP